MPRWRNGLGAAAVISLLIAPRNAAADDFASPAVDASAFRSGELVRSQHVFGSWTLVCDSVPKLRQRFCSLSAPVVDDGGKTIAAIVVSTGDDNRPAALLRVPTGLVVAEGVSVTAEPKERTDRNKRDKAVPARKLWRIRFALCKDSVCSAVWTLDPSQIALLQSGLGLRVAFDRAAPAAGLNFARTHVSGRLSGEGFGDAIRFSTQ